MDNDIDYKALLKNYIRHVVACEGVSFIDNSGGDYDENLFTKSEWEELQKLDKSLYSK